MSDRRWMDGRGSKCAPVGGGGRLGLGLGSVRVRRRGKGRGRRRAVVEVRRRDSSNYHSPYARRRGEHCEYCFLSLPAKRSCFALIDFRPSKPQEPEYAVISPLKLLDELVSVNLEVIHIGRLGRPAHDETFLVRSRGLGDHCRRGRGGGVSRAPRAGAKMSVLWKWTCCVVG